MQRFGQLIGVKPEKLEEYKQYHAAVWPTILAMITECNIRNYSIFEKDHLLFAYFEYVGEDFAAAWLRWPRIPRRSGGGISRCRARRRSRPAPRASGGRRWKRCFITIECVVRGAWYVVRESRIDEQSSQLGKTNSTRQRNMHHGLRLENGTRTTQHVWLQLPIS